MPNMGEDMLDHLLCQASLQYPRKRGSACWKLDNFWSPSRSGCTQSHPTQTIHVAMVPGDLQREVY